jgi:hypothetical protein
VVVMLPHRIQTRESERIYNDPWVSQPELTHAGFLTQSSRIRHSTHHWTATHRRDHNPSSCLHHVCMCMVCFFRFSLSTTTDARARLRRLPAYRSGVRSALFIPLTSVHHTKRTERNERQAYCQVCGDSIDSLSFFSFTFSLCSFLFCSFGACGSDHVDENICKGKKISCGAADGYGVSLGFVS